MAPTKSTSNYQADTAAMANVMPVARKGALSRKKSTNNGDHNLAMPTMQTRGKRKAENSPIKNEKIKRSALGNLTNNVKLMSLTNNNKKSNTNEDNNLFGGMQLQILKDCQNVVNLKNNNGTNSGGNGYLNGSSLQKKDLYNVPMQQNKIATRASSKNLNGVKTLDEETCKMLANAASAAFALKAKENHNHVNSSAGLSQANLVLNQVPAAPIVIQAAVSAVKVQQKPVRRISNEFNKTEESLYMSALDISTSESIRLSGNFEVAKRRSISLQNQKTEDTEKDTKLTDEERECLHITNEANIKALQQLEEPKIPKDIEDFDKINWNDPFQVSYYAMDIFSYLKTREKDFPIHDYMEKQVHLSKWMRSLLVDWMVEVQETFELNHETLYLAVKIVDLYLCRVVIYKDKLQLLGAAALFIACKFDERTPPLIEDFLYICDGAYKQDELIQMEIQALKTIGFDLGIPLSYRFLRRYARCGKVPMPTLTLARYILELSLMDYAVISCSDSQLAAAALFMALRLHGEEKAWTPTLEYYSGYKLSDFAELVPLLNAGLHRKPKGTIKTIRSKYSHKIFHEVAKVPLMTVEQLFEKNLDLNSSSIQMQIDDETNNQKFQKPPPPDSNSNESSNS